MKFFIQERSRSIRSNKFLISLAMADLCVGMFVMIPSVVKIQAEFTIIRVV